MIHLKVKDLTTNFLRSLDNVELAPWFWLRFTVIEKWKILKRNKIKSKPKQKIELNNIERTQRVRVQNFTVRIFSDCHVNNFCLIEQFSV
eukprot:UN17113